MDEINFAWIHAVLAEWQGELTAGCFVLSAIAVMLVILCSGRRDAAYLYERQEMHYGEAADALERIRAEIGVSARDSRKENADMLMRVQEALSARLERQSGAGMQMLSAQQEKIREGLVDVHEVVTRSLSGFFDTLSSRLDTLSATTGDALSEQQKEVRSALKDIRESNERKLEEMRKVVDEKLQDTLEKRLTGSFEIVSRQLEAVQKGLGEMQSLAGDVGGLKRALTNVKVAGNVGEYQLEALLSQILSPRQCAKNVHPNPSHPERVVEFAVKIPSKESEGEYIWLPIDSKFPTATYHRLLADFDASDKEAVDSDRRILASEIKKFAKDIRDKYIEVPYTTDFGIMFLPFEGLYAEVIRIPGLLEEIQRSFGITITGPTTLCAFLSSLQMGFRTLAIQSRTNEVWSLLGAVRTEFGKFGAVLESARRKIESAGSELEKTGIRTRAIERRLRAVEAVPEKEADDMLEG